MEIPKYLLCPPPPLRNRVAQPPSPPSVIDGQPRASLRSYSFYFHLKRLARLRWGGERKESVKINTLLPPLPHIHTTISPPPPPNHSEWKEGESKSSSSGILYHPYLWGGGGVIGPGVASGQPLYDYCSHLTSLIFWWEGRGFIGPGVASGQPLYDYRSHLTSLIFWWEGRALIGPGVASGQTLYDFSAFNIPHLWGEWRALIGSGVASGRLYMTSVPSHSTSLILMGGGGWLDQGSLYMTYVVILHPSSLAGGVTVPGIKKTGSLYMTSVGIVVNLVSSIWIL
jgi:hypothetical protein